MVPQRVSLLFRRSPVAVRPASSHAPPVAEPVAKPEPEDDGKIAEQLVWLQQLLNDIGVAVEDLQQQHRDTIAEMQQTTVELAIVAASWIVGVAIDENMFAIDDLVRSMIDQLHREQPIRIHLNSDDAALLNALKSSSETQTFSDAEVEFLPAPELARGIVRAESSRSTLVTDMEDRLADIRRIWMENLNETQTERRADDPAGRGFRRFPERRHTA